MSVQYLYSKSFLKWFQSRVGATPLKEVAGCCNELLYAKAMKAADANASAAWYSLETAKTNELEPSRYLRFLFERLPYARTSENYGNSRRYALTARSSKLRFSNGVSKAVTYISLKRLVVSSNFILYPNLTNCRERAKKRKQY